MHSIGTSKAGKTLLLIILLTVASVLTFSLGYSIGHYSKSGNNNPGNPSSSNSHFAVLESVYEILAKDFYYGQDTEEYRSWLVDMAIKGMVDANGDIHTEYFTAKEMEQFISSLESSIVGIGVRYTTIDGNIFVIEALESSPARKAGIQSGDFIIAVEGVKCVDHDSDYMADLIAGKEGTDVTITVERGGEVFDVTITRAVIETTVISEIRDDVGIIYITSFGTDTGTELGKHLQKLTGAGITRFVIDLRDNGGGYASTLDEMCRYFMNNGEIVMREEYRDGKEIIDKVTKSKKIKYDKLVILLNGNSASCSEVFTMALIENCGAITVGTTSYGKGIAQLSQFFNDGSGFKYTDVIWKSGNGVSIHKKGITPDYIVELHPALSTSYLAIPEGEQILPDSVSAKVLSMQLILDFMGYDVDRTDGYFSVATEEALKKFQADYGLEATGILDKKTGDTLDSRMTYTWHMNKAKYDTQMQKALELVKQ